MHDHGVGRPKRSPMSWADTTLDFYFNGGEVERRRVTSYRWGMAPLLLRYGDLFGLTEAPRALSRLRGILRCHELPHRIHRRCLHTRGECSCSLRQHRRLGSFTPAVSICETASASSRVLKTSKLLRASSCSCIGQRPRTFE